VLLDALQPLSSLLIAHVIAQLLQIEGPQLADLDSAGNLPAGGFLLDVALLEPEDANRIIDSAALALHHIRTPHATRERPKQKTARAFGAERRSIPN
jgi:hypothetical protein